MRKRKERGEEERKWQDREGENGVKKVESKVEQENDMRPIVPEKGKRSSKHIKEKDKQNSEQHRKLQRD